ncbi:MAG TPA: SDR family oxidoreductase [Acidimicrobiales bacterium]|nr:SDR family oxidoreductase [Acidimicrobiales bacterium]
MPTAIVTGGSKGLGKALATELARQGWSLVIDGRDGTVLDASATEMTLLAQGAGASLVAIPGSVTDAGHRHELVAAARHLGALDLLVNNASTLGPSPLPALADYPLEALRAVFETNVVAPLALTQAALPLLRSSTRGRVLDVTSDAAVEAYPGWGGYGASKAALEQLSAVLAAEETQLRVWWLDPGDLRTEMHQLAFPGEDISDRPPPEDVAPLLAALVASDLPSGRYRAADLASLTGARQ